MTVDEIVMSLGVVARDDEQVTLVVIDGERTTHYALDEVAALDPAATPSLYLASGTFRPGTISRGKGGRTVDNVARVLWLPFDCDLADWLDFPAGKTAREQEFAWLWGLADDELLGMVANQREDVTEAFATLGLPIHRLDYTGYGLCAYVRVDEADQTRVADARAAHKLLIARLNEIAGYQLVDPQTSDAGTRITRLPDSLNHKGAKPRRVRTLLSTPGSVPLGLRPTGQQPPMRMIPRDGAGLPDADVDALVAAVSSSWGLGQKHALALGLGGMLAKAGVPETQALAIVERLSTSDRLPGKKGKAVRDSYARVRSGLAVAGFTRLRDLLGADAVSFVDGLLARYRQATAPTITIGGAAQRPAEVAPKPAAAPVPPPAEAFFGWFGDYLSLVEPTTEAPDAFHLGAGLTLAGAMIGRRVRTKYASDDLYANLYTVLIGPSGSSRKDTAIKRALALPQFQRSTPVVYVDPAFRQSRDVSSAEGLVHVLKDQHNTLLYLTELSAMIGNARRKSTSTILDKLIEAWDTPSTLENNSKLNPAIAMSPYLSIIAATQPGRFAGEITDEDIHSGFANRWLYLVGVGKDARPHPPALDADAAWALYLRLKTIIERYADGQVLSVDADAGARWDAWYLAQHNDRELDEEAAAMRVRHATLIQKLALIYAVSEGASRIGDRHIAPAMALVEWMWGHVQQLMREWGVGIQIQLERRIVGQLERHGVLTRRQVQMHCGSRRWSSRDFAMTFEAMQKNGTLAVDPLGQVTLGSDIP